MSAKTIKASGWAHKSPPVQVGRTSGSAPVEMVRVFRNATHVLTPGGSLARASYELTRATHPDLALPAFDDLPLHSSVFHSSIQ